MKTVSVNVMNLCAPCSNRCRYCLLSYDGRVNGVDTDRAMDYARRFAVWLRENRPDVDFLFGWGYSMEHPRLFDMIRCAQELGCITGEFLQFDGMTFRRTEELTKFLTELKAAGIRTIDLTFYGTEAYHDRFAARRGDYRLMMNTLAAANQVGLDVSVSIPLTQENVGQVDTLLDELGRHDTLRTACFVPHGEGRGALLDPVRLKLEDFRQLSPKVQGLLNRKRFRTEGEWVREDAPDPEERRVLTFVLTPESFMKLDQMGFARAMEYLEELDDAYDRALPSFGELLRLYGNPEGQHLYSKRDLHQHYQRRYITQKGLALYDIHDERQSFARRF